MNSGSRCDAWAFPRASGHTLKNLATRPVCVTSWLLAGAWLLAVMPLSAGVGQDWGVERESYTDPITGVRIWEVTRGPSASDNLYFHFSNFTADNRFLVLISNRTGRWQLYRHELASGHLVQLTEDPAVAAHTACLDPTDARRLYCVRGNEVIALDIIEFAARTVGRLPRPAVGGFGQLTLSGDGQWLTLARQREASNWELGLMHTQTGQYRTVLTEGFRIGHVQYSPKADLIFYVWETGGYAPQRSWLVNADGTGNRPFYARTDPKTWLTPLKEWLTHEAWVTGTGAMTMVNDKLGLMLVQPDGSARLVSEGNYWHGAARPAGEMLVADDFQGRLWLIETRTGNKRLLATGLRDQVHAIHPHPSFDRFGHYVQFHSGRTHETVAYLDLATLPKN